MANFVRQYCISRAKSAVKYICSAHGAFGVAGADDAVDFVYDQDNVADALYLIDKPFHPALKLTAELGPGNKRSEVQQIDFLVLQLMRDITFGNTHGQTLGDRRFAYARLADEAGVVLLPPVEDLYHTLDLAFTPDNTVDLALDCLLGKRYAVAVKKPSLRFLVYVLLSRLSRFLCRAVSMRIRPCAGR